MTIEQNKEFAGFHSNHTVNGTCRFEVFHEDGSDPLLKTGWYWWLRRQGYIAESDQEGPFPTAEGAYLDALEGGVTFTTPASWVKAINFLDELRHFDTKTAEAEAEALDRDLNDESIDTALEEGTRYERAFGDGNDVGG